ncbi:MAG: ROK family protein [Armatimonadota bacterium]|nr:ROK family protein [Armatimonadota bacterium]
MSTQYVVGVDLGGTNVRAAVVDSSGKILGEARTDSKAMEGADVTLGQIIKAIRAAVADARVSEGEIAACGMGIPGTVKNAEGLVLWSPNFKDWNGIQVRDPIAKAIGAPVSMGNDANVAALGEYAFGAGKGARCMIMLTLGTGIGSGLIIEGKSWNGVSEVAPEMGHHIILADGPRCSCGRYGCVESLCRRDAIVDRAARKAHQGRYTSLIEKSGHDLRYVTPAMIAEAAREGDQVSIETLEETGYYLGIAVANIINIFNPDKVIIGGGIAQAGDLLFDPIRRTVEVNALYEALQVCEILPAALGDDAGVLGAAALALQSLGVSL